MNETQPQEQVKPEVVLEQEAAPPKPADDTHPEFAALLGKPMTASVPHPPKQADAVQCFWARANGFDIDNLDYSDPVIAAALEKTADFMNKHDIKKKDGGGGDS